MTLEHVAIWTQQLEEMKAFYTKYFDAVPNEKYESNSDFHDYFESYFLSFNQGARLEIMQMASIPQGDSGNGKETTGLTHIAFSVETQKELDDLADRLQEDNQVMVGMPRMTGDGYYEACVLDPDGNRVEITVTPA